MGGPTSGGADYGGLLDVLAKDRPALRIAKQEGAWAYVPDDAQEALTERLGLAGNGTTPLAALLDDAGEEAATNASAALTNAMATGSNPLNIVANLAQVLQMSEGRAETVARTELLGAYRDAQMANYRANADVVRGWMWSSGGGANTCAACMFMDGTVHGLDEEMDTHCNCRCSPIPVTNSWDDLLSPYGIDASDIPDTSIDIGYEPMMDWFNTQAGVIEQEAILGPAKYEAWARGDITIGDLVGWRDDPKWGVSIYEKSLKELGLDARDYLGKNAVEGVRVSELPEKPPPTTVVREPPTVITRTGTYPDGRTWEVRDYKGPTPPSETTVGAFEGLGSDAGEHWTPKWEYAPESPQSEWVDGADRWRIGANNDQCLNCYRVYGGPLDGEYPDHMVFGSHGYCPQCEATNRAGYLTRSFERANPEASAADIQRMVQQKMQAEFVETTRGVRATEVEAIPMEAPRPSIGLGSPENIKAREAALERFYEGMPVGDPMTMMASEDAAIQAAVKHGEDQIDHVLDRMATRLEGNQKFMRLARWLGYDRDTAEAWLVVHPEWTMEQALHENVKDALYRLFEGFHAIPAGAAENELFVQTPLQIAMQEAARSEFGLSKAVGYWSDEATAAARETWGSYRNGLRAFFRAQYDETQAWFAERGITEVQLFRGMRWTADTVPQDITFDGRVIESSVNHAPMTSWSSNAEVALDYARDIGGIARPATTEADFGMVVSTKVPVDQVLSTPFTGLGTPPLREIIVLGVPDDALALPFAMREAPNLEGVYGAFADTKAEAQAARDVTELRGGGVAGEERISAQELADLKTEQKTYRQKVGQLERSAAKQRAAIMANPRDPLREVASGRLARTEMQLERYREQLATVNRFLDEAQVQAPKLEERFSQLAPRRTAADLRQEESRLQKVLDQEAKRETAAESKERIAETLATTLRENPDWGSLAHDRFEHWAGLPGNPETLAARGQKLVDNLMRSWGAGFGDADSVLLHEAAAREFGLSDPLLDRLLGTENSGMRDYINKEMAAHEAGYRAFVRAIYDQTQAHLSEEGITELVLYRGVYAQPGEELAGFVLDGKPHVVDMRLQPLSSFTVDAAQARDFALGYGLGEDAEAQLEHMAIMGVRVPADQVFSTSWTGIGAKDEGEVVILGGSRQAVAIGGGAQDLNVDTLMNEMARIENMAARDVTERERFSRLPGEERFSRLPGDIKAELAARVYPSGRTGAEFEQWTAQAQANERAALETRTRANRVGALHFRERAELERQAVTYDMQAKQFRDLLSQHAREVGDYFARDLTATTQEFLTDHAAGAGLDWVNVINRVRGEDAVALFREDAQAAYLEKPGFKALQEAAMAMKEDSAGVRAASDALMVGRTLPLVDAAGEQVAGSLPEERSYAIRMHQAILAAKPDAPVLYRGIIVQEDDLAAFKVNYRVGAQIDIGVASHSTERSVAEELASPSQAGWRGATAQDQGVVFHVERGAQAVHTDPLSSGGFFDFQKEWVTGGRYEVTKVGFATNEFGDRVLHIALRQTAVYDPAGEQFVALGARGAEGAARDVERFSRLPGEAERVLIPGRDLLENPAKIEDFSGHGAQPAWKVTDAKGDQWFVKINYDSAMSRREQLAYDIGQRMGIAEDAIPLRALDMKATNYAGDMQHWLDQNPNVAKLVDKNKDVSFVVSPWRAGGPLANSWDSPYWQEVITDLGDAQRQRQLLFEYVVHADDRYHIENYWQFARGDDIHVASIDLGHALAANTEYSFVESAFLRADESLLRREIPLDLLRPIVDARDAILRDAKAAGLEGDRYKALQKRLDILKDALKVAEKDASKQITVESLENYLLGDSKTALVDRPLGGAAERFSALPKGAAEALQQRVADTLGQETASDWADTLGEHGQLHGPIADREEVLAWEPKETSAEVSEALREQLGTVHVNVDDFDPAVANQFAQTMRVLDADWPEVFDEQMQYIGQTGRDFSGFNPDSTLGRTRYSLASSNGPVIGFNRYFFSMAKTDAADLTALLQNRVEEGWFFAGAGSPASQLAHEFGHSLYWWALDHENNEIGQMVFDYLDRWHGEVPAFSDYAATDRHELFAEAFAANYFGTAEVLADPMVADMGRLLENLQHVLAEEPLAEAAVPGVERQVFAVHEERFVAQPSLTREALAEKPMPELRQMARDMDVQPARTKAETIDRILAKDAEVAPKVAPVEPAGEEPAVVFHEHVEPTDPASMLRAKVDERLAQRELLYGQQHDLLEEKTTLENAQRDEVAAIERAQYQAKQDLYRETLDKSDPEVKRYFKDRAAYLKAKADQAAAKADMARLERVMDRLSLEGKAGGAEFAQAKADYDAAAKVDDMADRYHGSVAKAYENLWSKSPGVYKPELDSIAGFEMKMQQMGITFSPQDIANAPSMIAARERIAAIEPRLAELKTQLKALDRPLKALDTEIKRSLADLRDLNVALGDSFDTMRPFSGALELPEEKQPPNALMNKLDYRMHEPRAVTKGRIIDDIAVRLKENPAWAEYVDRMPTPDNLGIYHQYVHVSAEARDTKSAKLVADLVRKWGIGYNPGSPSWAALQLAARDEFGLDAAIHSATAEQIRAGEAVYAKDGAALRTFLRAMYDNTQKWFAEHGITEIDVYRGFSWRQVPEFNGAHVTYRDPPDIPTGINWGPLDRQNHGIADIELNPFQSFSADINISQGTTQIGGFGGGFAQDGDYNLLIGARVPVDRVLSTAQTGFGAKLESEIVVLGRLTDTVAYRAGTAVAEALLRQAEEQVIRQGEVLYTLADGASIHVAANVDGTFTLSYLAGPQGKLGTLKVGASKTYKTVKGLNRNLKAMGLANVYVAP